MPLIPPEETLPETLSVLLLCSQLTSSPMILVAKRLQDVTKSVTIRRVQKTRKIAISFSSASSTTRLDRLSHKETWTACVASLTNEGSSSLSASITLHAWVAVPTHQFPTTGHIPTTPTLRLVSPLLPREAILAQRRQRLSQRIPVHRL
jgi:hypothetical protein